MLVRNLRYMAMVFTDPARLVATFPPERSIPYGMVPFALYMGAFQAGILAARAAGRWRAINPLPKLLPIPDDKYPVYQAVCGVLPATISFPCGRRCCASRLLSAYSARLE